MVGWNARVRECSSEWGAIVAREVFVARAIPVYSPSIEQGGWCTQGGVDPCNSEPGSVVPGKAQGSVAPCNSVSGAS